MSLFRQKSGRRSATGSPRRKLGALFAGLFALAPGLAAAAEGENVVLNFTQGDMIYLYISLFFGLLSLIVGFAIAKSVLAQDPGNERMQQVSGAIKEGALAYLRRQVQTMLPFVVILAIGLFLLYYKTWGTALAVYLAICFVGGVAASYIAGYTGMLMAVNGNCRTAAAALTSYKKSLETAFRSGSVAGLITVGMGLLGATIIFLAAKADAMKLLVGFGFGGSLAALFMRVGGGIFTKAADVGADLVGKVEAGIPEDDPRNPATIADNVGDNVGDCAGMAADVFESYEVTLVAAIILGAATAAIFDQATWMKLVLFALMARGVGILASIFGILTVRGNDDVDTDPLAPIRGGFQRSAVVAAILTALVAWFMMGRPGTEVQTNVLRPVSDILREQWGKIKAVQNDIAKKEGIAVADVDAAKIQSDPRIKALGLDGSQDAAFVNSLLSTDESRLPQAGTLAGYQKVDFQNLPENLAKVLTYKTDERGQPLRDETGTPQLATIKEAWADKQFVVVEIQTQGSPNSSWFGPIDAKVLDNLLKQIKESPQGNAITEKRRLPVELYANNEGRFIAAIEGQIDAVHRLNTTGNALVTFVQSEAKVKEMLEKAKTDFTAPQPQQVAAELAVVEHKDVGWWRFFVCIAFGIAMAFAIELLTDFYVSVHKSPVREVSGTSTTGPATMIITGFAYGMESSVFSVFAIVVALIAPLLIFPPAEFGGYLLSFYGIALVGLGLLTTTGYILAMDTFGPISDNAQGVYEMSGAGHDNETAMKAVQRLDAAGNTTKALTKGFAIATAVVAAVALFHSYVEGAMLTSSGLRIEVPEIFLGLLIGGAAPYLFSAFSINAVGRAAFQLINEVRRQFRNDPGIMAGTSKPNYGECVAIVTKAAQQELLGPGILAIFLPAAVAFGFSIGKPTTTVGGMELNLVGAQALGGFLAGAILSGQLMAVLLANSGGIWDNAKKLIEDGMYGGKGSDAHKAGVVCDTVGDPFKDTAGPALNPLIKVMNLVALILAPVVILPLSNNVLIVVTVGCLVVLGFSVYWSKRSSMSTALQQIGAQASSPALDVPGETVPESPKSETRIKVDD
ncbi:MAG: sodium/proton-translocating pyrophosphatase [Fimbriimonadales bacterium]